MAVSVFLCPAVTIVQFIGPATGTNNGSVYDGPYDLTLNGDTI